MFNTFPRELAFRMAVGFTFVLNNRPKTYDANDLIREKPSCTTIFKALRHTSFSHSSLLMRCYFSRYSSGENLSSLEIFITMVYIQMLN